MLNISVQQGISLDFDEFATFQKQAFAAQSGLMRAEIVQTPQYYRWKYLTPWGAAKISIAALNDKLAAVVAAVPHLLTDGVHTRMGWQLCDIATIRTHRRQRLFRRCLTLLLSSLPPDSVIFCFPNRQSFGALSSMGFVQTGALRLWASISPLLNLTRRAAWEESWDLNSSPPSITPDIFRTLVGNAYLHWRFAQRPDHVYRRIGAYGHHGGAIVRSLAVAGQDISVLMMIMNSEATTEKEILRSVVSFESDRGARAILYLDSNWQGSVRPLFLPLPSWALPRTFPIVSVGLAGASLHLHTCDWDVL